jgi:hypothetical protein
MSLTLQMFILRLSASAKCFISFEHMHFKFVKIQYEYQNKQNSMLLQVLKNVHKKLEALYLENRCKNKTIKMSRNFCLSHLLSSFQSLITLFYIVRLVTVLVADVNLCPFEDLTSFAH